MKRPGPRTLLLLFCSALGSIGCERLQRNAQCRELAALVNPKISEFEALTKEPNAESFDKLARGYQELADAVAALPIAEGAAAGDVKSYADALRAAAKSSGDYAVALRVGGRTDKAERELERVTRREKVAANRIAAHCSP